MTPETKVLLDTLPEIRARLAQATERLNACIQDADNALLDLQLGVRAAVPLRSEDNSSLVYGRFKDKWCLFVTKGGLPLGALTNQSRELRIRAVEALPALVKAMFDAAVNEAVRVDKACEDLDKTVDDIERIEIE